jgi:peroxiredoxin
MRITSSEGEHDSVDATLFDSAIRNARTQDGRSLHEISCQAPVLIIFLRHFGCTFCRQALDDLSKERKGIEGLRTQLCFVHMGTEELAADFFARYGLEDLPRISDPECGLYEMFGLQKGSGRRLLSLEVWMKGLKAFISGGHFIGSPSGDVRQMPGAFLIFQGAILRSFIHNLPSDRPNYAALSDCGDDEAALFT